MANKLYRNEKNKIIAGVASGVADYLNVDPTWVRLAFVLAVFAGLSGILIYIILWIVVPPAFGGIEADYRVYEDKNAPPRKNNSRIIAGGILIIFGLCFLSNEFDLLPYWFSIEKLWPLALIIPGILILASAGKTDREEHLPVATNIDDPEKKQGLTDIPDDEEKTAT